MFLLSVVLFSVALSRSDGAAIHSGSFGEEEAGESGESNVPNYSLQYKGRKVYPDVYFYPSQSFLWIRKSPLVKKSVNSQPDYLKGGNYDTFKREAAHTEECIDDNNKTTFIIVFLVILFLAIIIICVVIIFVKKNKSPPSSITAAYQETSQSSKSGRRAHREKSSESQRRRKSKAAESVQSTCSAHELLSWLAKQSKKGARIDVESCSSGSSKKSKKSRSKKKKKGKKNKRCPDDTTETSS